MAKADGWLSSSLDLDDEWDFYKAKIGDYAEIVRMVKNLSRTIQPGSFWKKDNEKIFRSTVRNC